MLPEWCEAWEAWELWDACDEWERCVARNELVPMARPNTSFARLGLRVDSTDWSPVECPGAMGVGANAYAGRAAAVGSANAATMRSAKRAILGCMAIPNKNGVFRGLSDQKLITGFELVVRDRCKTPENPAKHLQAGATARSP